MVEPNPNHDADVEALLNAILKQLGAKIDAIDPQELASLREQVARIIRQIEADAETGKDSDDA